LRETVTPGFRCGGCTPERGDNVQDSSGTQSNGGEEESEEPSRTVRNIDSSKACNEKEERGSEPEGDPPAALIGLSETGQED
jgi:hypothetical protein